MCDVSNAKDIVEELLQVLVMLNISNILYELDRQSQFMFFWVTKTFSIFYWKIALLLTHIRCQYLSTAEFAMREELSLKAAILAEKFAPDLSW